MDIFWIFILLFGVIVSIGQKANKQQAPTGEEGEPTLSPEEDMERRIRELLEGKPAHKAPKPSPKPINAPTPTHSEGSTTPQPSAQSVTSQRSYTPKHASTSAKMTTPPRMTTSARTASQAPKSAKASPKQANVATNPIKRGEIKQSEIGRIIDDFTIEKATIYAEIMHPKYEEY